MTKTESPTPGCRHPDRERLPAELALVRRFIELLRPLGAADGRRDGSDGWGPLVHAFAAGYLGGWHHRARLDADDAAGLGRHLDGIREEIADLVEALRQNADFREPGHATVFGWTVRELVGRLDEELMIETELVARAPRALVWSGTSPDEAVAVHTHAEHLLHELTLALV